MAAVAARRGAGRRRGLCGRSTRCGCTRASTCAADLEPPATLAASSSARARPPRPGRRRGAPAASGSRSSAPDLPVDRTAIAQEIVRVARPIGHQRGGHALPRLTSRTGRRCRGRRTLRPQAGLPAAGNEPRDQHHRLEGRRPARVGAGGRRRRPSSRRCASRCRMSSEPCAAMLFIISAPSGTGKTTLVERLVQVVPDLALSRSYTSRPPRAGEQDGVDYNFISRERFEAMIADGDFLEWADVFGNSTAPARPTPSRRWPRAGPGAGHRRAGRPAGAEPAASRASASSCCRRPSRCSRTAARAKQGHRGADSAAPRGRARRGRAPCTTTSTSS